MIVETIIKDVANNISKASDASSSGELMYGIEQNNFQQAPIIEI